MRVVNVLFGTIETETQTWTRAEHIDQGSLCQGACRERALRNKRDIDREPNYKLSPTVQSNAPNYTQVITKFSGPVDRLLSLVETLFDGFVVIVVRINHDSTA